MIDLARFSEQKRVIVPIVDGWGRINGRKITQDIEDGWYEFLIGDNTNLIKKASQLAIEKRLVNEKSYLGFPIGKEFIPANFDTFQRRGHGESVRIYFSNTNRLFCAASVVRLEDGRYYFWKEEPRFAHNALQAIRECFDRGDGIGELHEITPEQRYLFILARLYQNSYNAYRELQQRVISEDEKSKHLRNFKLDFGTRLKKVVEEAGGRLNSYTKSGSGYTIDWTVGGQRIKSIINDDMRILNAGFCLSGDDEKHSMSSIILLAKMFQERAPLYITRE